MTDLFLTNEKKLQQWCKARGFFSTADIMRYATDNYYLRAKRTINDLVNEKLVRIIPKDECIFRGLKGRMGWYEYMRYK